MHPPGVSIPPLAVRSASSDRYPDRRDKVFIAPSGVQKERILPDHIFVLPYPQPSPSPPDRVFLRRPTIPLKESACTPLFWNAFTLRDAGSCIHTHSQHAVMATLLFGDATSTKTDKIGEFRISHQEMIKGVRLGGTGKALSYLDTLVVPIIDNTPNEEDLKDSMAEAMEKYPDAAGILVRRHGVYVWGRFWHVLYAGPYSHVLSSGPDWEKAKTQAEVRRPVRSHATCYAHACSAVPRLSI